MITESNFFDFVCKMRKAQREYFKTRSKEALEKSIALERVVDSYIETMNDLPLFKTLEDGKRYD